MTGEKPQISTQCKHCKGTVAVVHGSRGQSFLRCQSCGRTPLGSGERIPVARETHPVVREPARCRVRGCPGELDPDGRCACCEARAEWADAHRPKKCCAICGGEFPRTRGRRKLCVACTHVVSAAAREQDANLERQEKEAE